MKKYKGEIKDFPEEIVECMLKHQVDQGNVCKISVFEQDRHAPRRLGGFNWEDSIEGYEFWASVIGLQHFKIFFNKSPRQKEIASYVFKNEEFKNAAEAIFGFNYVLANVKPTGPIINKLKELNVLDVWCIPVYKEKSEVVDMGKFSLTIKDKKVFHKNEEITEFVRNISNNIVEKFSIPSNNGNRTIVIKEVIFSKTGCEDSETTLSQWKAVYNKIK